MQKLSALLSALITTILNAVLCYAINRFPVEKQFADQLHPLIVALAVVSVVGIALCGNQSSNPHKDTETTNHPSVISFLPLIGSAILLGLLKTNQLPSDLTKYANIASLILFVLGTLLPTVLLLVKAWQSSKTSEHTNSGTTGTLSIQRMSSTWQALQNAVKTEVEDRLAQCLHSAVLLNLGKESQPQQVNRPWDVDVKIGQQPSYQLASETKIIDVFNDSRISGKLLILGEPGSGKTTTLLGLARDLINLAENNVDRPIPVLLNLSSWKEDNQSIADWLVVELKLKYGLRVDIGKQWLDEHKLLPLLDGLDEIESERQEQCVQAINQFLASDSRPVHLLVCSRKEEYASSDTVLSLNGAIYLEPLNEIQIQEYLASVDLPELWQSIKTNDDLLTLAKSPLLLSMIALTAQEISFEGWQKFNTPELRLQYLLDTYSERMLMRPYKDKGKQPTKENIQHWLIWLSKNLNQENQSDILIEKIQPIWLRSRNQKLMYCIGVGLIISSITGLIFPLIWGVQSGLVFSIFVGLATGLNEVINNPKIKPVETISFSWERVHKFLIVKREFIWIFYMLGLVTAVKIGKPISGLVSGFLLVLIFMLGLLVIDGLSGPELERKIYPNQGILQSVINAGIFALIGAVISVISWVLFLLNLGLPIALRHRLIFGLGAGLLLGIAYGGGIAAIQHFTLRLILWWNGYIPWNYARFLNFATERMFLQRVGGRYRFIHRLLQDRFAQMEPKQQ